MHFNVLAILSLANIVSASAILETSSSLAILSKRAAYSCKGNTLCGSTANLRTWCDNTVNNKIIRNDVVNYGPPGSGLPSGGCTGNVAGFGCGVFVEGNSGCTMSGNAIWWAYQDIRNSGCQICGQADFGNGCYLTIDRVSSC
ncbi:hypothetical protein VE03_05358 [Pseudogymnoascus sp. 23342-1-I1]|nr:hypothetical protein VE03_05358 [Pseudogymnoascus sp. 23342-1-I1]